MELRDKVKLMDLVSEYGRANRAMGAANFNDSSWSQHADAANAAFDAILDIVYPRTASEATNERLNESNLE